MNVKIKFFTALLAMLAVGAVFADAATTSRQVDKTAVPDFAFPDKVAADADARLGRALDAGDGAEVVNALVCYSLARNAVSPSMLPAVIERIDSVARAEDDQCVKSLLYLLEAQIYNGLYNRNKWQYDRREIPVDSLSADYTAWSGEQFKRRIGSLLDKAVAPQDELLASPLKDWSRIIDSDEYTYIFYPTLYDLVAYNAISIYESMAASRDILPFRFLKPELILRPISLIAQIDGYSRRAHELSIDLARVHAVNPAPEITARLRAVECMQSMAVNDDNYDIDDTYMALYREFAHSEYADEALLACSQSSDNEYLDTLKAALERFPRYFRADALRQRIARAEQPGFSYRHSGNVTPGHPFKMTVKLSNTTKGTLMFYRDPNGMKSDVRSNTVTQSMRQAAIKHEINVAPRPLPYSVDTTVVVTLTEPGRYFVWSEIDERKSKNDRFDVLYCTDIAPITIGFNGNVYPYAVNSMTGAPMAGVTVSSKSYRNNSFTKQGVTGNDGTIGKHTDAGYRIMLTRGMQSVTSDSPWSYRSGTDKEWRTKASFFTSLPLYHHGDSVEWAIVANRSLNGKNEILAGKKLTVKIFDANGESVDSVTVVTDASGRAQGVTHLPADGLSGRYSASVFDGDYGCCWSSFMVNDYKLPTFKVEVTDVKRSSSPDSAVTVTCMAKTFSMFPVADAKVSVVLSDMPRYWWQGYGGQKFWSTDTVTSPDGTLQLALSRELLDLSPNGSGRYMVTFNVTSAGGETRSCSQVISTGKPYTIVAEGDQDIEIKSPVDFGVRVVDANGAEARIPLRYKIMDDTVCVAEFEGDRLPENIKPDMYDIIVSPVDSTLVDPLTIEDVTLYLTKGPSPFELAIYLPVVKYDATGDYVDVLLGSGVDDANLLVTVSVDNELAKREWYKPVKGMQYYRVAVPAGCNQVQVQFNAVHDNNHEAGSVWITNQRSVKELGIVMESFRDKVVPGTPERITLSVNTNKIPSQASVIMLMESQSILQLQGHNLVMYLSHPSFPSISYGHNYINIGNTIYGTMKDFEWPSITVPALDLYGYNFASSFNRNLRIRGRRYMTDDMNAVREHKDEVIVEEECEAVAYDAAPAYKMNLMSSAAGVAVAEDAEEDAGLALEEVVVTGYGTQKKQSMTGSVSVGREDSFSYRPSEIPLAFFAPMLSTDSAGVLSYTYTVPDANTTWVLKALAYTPDLFAASLQRTVTSSRPVMVQPTLPRFLRYGDSTVFRAVVMNATDSVQIVNTTVSILNPVDMSLLGSTTSSDTITAGGNVTVTIPFTASAEGQAVIYRVKSQAGNYSDGEQSMLPLLPASQPVITSSPFFMAPDSTEFTFEIPAQGADNRSTLYLYDNPLWEVVTALPSLNDGEAKTSVGAMENIYMASVARGIMNANPVLKRALREWLESDRSDETLRSMLSRNDELKQLTINATPWARDAMSNNERLSSLALMLDDGNINSTIKRGVRTLKQLSMADGGLAWCTGFNRSSSWATYRVLSQVASLEERGYMPDNSDLRKIVSAAVGYIDAETAVYLKRNNGKGDYTQYAYLRSILRSATPSPTAKTAISITINNILKRWPGESPASKGVDAVILYRNIYPSIARKLVASIKAYSMTSPEKGTWWEGLGVNVAANLLYAIETVTPDDSALIHSVAQWLIMSKTNQSWNYGAATSATIDALLGAIDVKKAVNGKTSVALDGQSVSNDTPQLPGMVVADISSRVASHPATLTITKDTGLQAMGSVITRSVMVMDSIPAAGHPSVSVSKRLNVVRGTSVEGADSLSVGDRVKVQLVITVNDDLDYVTIVDRRAACLEPVDQLSAYTSKDGLWFYREVTDSETRMFIERLPRGTYVIDTDMNVVSQGSFTSGVATLQSQINPSVAANSSAKSLHVNE